MKLKKNRKKKLNVMMSLVLALTMASAGSLVAFAATASWTPPTTPMTVDKSVITVAARRAAQISPEILGANVVATGLIGGAGDAAIAHGTQGASVPLETAQQNAMLGIFGTSNNENPDPYYYNFFYNSYAAANGKTTTDDEVINSGQSGSPATADTTIVEAYGTSATLYRRPDILLGTDDNAGKSYATLIEDLPENKDADTSNDYNPYLIPYGMNTTYDMGDTLITMASVMEEIIAESNGARTTRYEDSPMTIAKDYNKYIRGIQAYVLAELEKNGIQKKVVAVINPADNNKDGTFLAYNTPTSTTAMGFRPAEYVENATTNLLSVLGKTPDSTGNYYLTAQELTQADVVVATVTGSKDTESEVKKRLYTYGVTESDIPPLLIALPDCVYGITMQSSENALGYGFFLGYIYNDVIDINPIYTSAYFYEKFLHIKDTASLQNAISANFANASKPAGVTASLDAYDPDKIETMIAEGMKYYEDNEDEFAGTKIYGTDGWDIDWTTGIGSNYNGGSDDNGTDNPGKDDGTDNPGADNSGTDNPRTDDNGADNSGTDNNGTDNNGVITGTVKTSDNSPIQPFLLTTLSAAAVTGVLLKRRRSIQ